MNAPKNLIAGDQVAVITIGKKIERSRIESAIRVYESWGLKVHVSKTIGIGDKYLAGTDELKIKELQKFINDTAIKAIFFARGGYGAVRVLDSIDFSPILTNKKWFVGFSDVTVIHNHINSNLNIASVHGIMPVFFDDATPAAINSCKNVLFNGKMDYQFTSEKPSSLNTNGICKGEITGGNLSIIYSLCGSKTAIDTKGKILFLEDLFEPLYHIDRMLQNLKRNGMFNNLAGVIIGSFTDIDKGSPAFSTDIESVFKEYFGDLDIPIYSGFPSGHINNNHSLIFGQKVEMEVLNNHISIKSLN